MARKLHVVWGILDLLLAAAGGVSTAFSIIWAKPDLLFNVIIKPSFRLCEWTNASVNSSGLPTYPRWSVGLIIGVALLASSVISIPAIIQPNRSNGLLKSLNVLLLADGVLATIVREPPLTHWHRLYADT